MSDISRRSLLAATAAAGLLPVRSRIALADAFPSRPIDWLLFSAAGGSIDLTSRIFQPFLASQGMQTHFDYVIGGGERIALTQLYRSPPDGYTIMTESGPGAAFGALGGDVAYKTEEFEPIFGWNVEGWQIATRKGGDIKTLKDLVALAAKKAIVAGTSSRGGGSHLQLLVLQKALGIKMNLVHFAASSQVYPQVISGNLDIGCGGAGSAALHLDELQVVSVFKDGGEPALPGVPTAKQQGYDVPSIDQFWYAMAGPKVPPDRIDWLAAAFAAAFAGDQFKMQQHKIGVQGLVAVDKVVLKQKVLQGIQIAGQYKSDLL